MTLEQVCVCELDDCFYCHQPVSLYPDCGVPVAVIDCDGPEVHCETCGPDYCDACIDQSARDWADDQRLACERGN